MTLESYPPDYSSVNDNLVYVVNDAHAADPVTYPNYKYVGELWIAGVKVFTARVFPHPSSNRGIFNFGAVVREYVIASLAPAGAGILAQELGAGAFSVSVVVKIKEEYSGTTGAVVLTDSARIFYNHYNGRYNDFTLLGSYVAKPLSTRPVAINLLFTNANYYLPYYSDTTTPFNVVITGGTATRTLTITPTATHTLQVLNISPGAINVSYAGNFTSASTGYTVAVGGVTYSVTIVCPGMYTNYTVHFLNKFGGFESMLFNKVRKQVNEIERKQWQQLPYRVNGSGVVSVKTGSIMHSQRTTFGSRFTQKLKVSTDLLTDAEYQWLAELAASPLVYLEEAGTLWPVTVTNTNYEQKEWIVDRTSNLSLDIEFGTTYKTQFQ